MKIFIPTMGRIDEQKTWEHIPEKWKAHTLLVCPQNEIVKHSALGRNVIHHPDNVKGISAVRQWIIERGHQDDDKIIMVDDDHWFFRREDPASVKLRKCTEDDLVDLFNWMEETLEEFAHIGVSARQGNNHVEEPFRDVTRVNNMHGYYRPALIKHNIKFTSVPLMEDFMVTLCLLRMGYPNRVNYEFVWNQSRGSGASGGCSSYRDSELQKEAAYILAQLHKPFVSVVEKKSKTGWDGMATRTDVRIQWQAAYKEGLEYGPSNPKLLASLAEYSK